MNESFGRTQNCCTSGAENVHIRNICLADCLLESAPGTEGMYIKACQIRHYLLVEGCSCSGSFGSSSPFYRESRTECIRGWSFLLCLIWDFFDIIISQFYRESHNVGPFVFHFQL